MPTSGAEWRKACAGGTASGITKEYLANLDDAAFGLVTQFELIGGGLDRARANVSETIGLLRGRPEKHEPREVPSLPPAKSLDNANGQLEDGIAEIAATLGGEHRPALSRGL